jgi:cyclopropane-fatty-acyl-phospholipid synthase
MWLLKGMLRRLGKPAIRVVFWDGQQIATGDAPPVAVVRIHDRRTLLGLLFNPILSFGDAYADGKIEVEGDLLEFMQTLYRANRATSTTGRSPRMRFPQRFFRLPSNTIRRSRHNVHHHYDLRADFYRMWLDEEMVYTCAYFPDPEMTIEQAQQAKMDYVCRKLRLCPGETVVEAGAGWGAFALHMARHFGVRVHAYNLSHEQTLYARQRAEVEGLAPRVLFVEDDYRNISGQFDVFVSVGMLEHVGRQHYRKLGEIIDRCLKPEGRGLIHSIGRDQPASLNAWIERRIFCGAYPPTLQEMMDIFQPPGFSVLDVENLRLHYARTLEHWLARYEAHEERVAAMFDRRFVRMWRLYLTGSMAGFLTGTLQLFQILFTRAGVNTIPWTRARLYNDR